MGWLFSQIKFRHRMGVCEQGARGEVREGSVQQRSHGERKSASHEKDKTREGLGMEHFWKSNKVFFTNMFKFI